MSRNFYVYIMGNSRPTLYIGVTNDLVRRGYEHKQGIIEGFTKKYGLKKLLYFEVFNFAEDAIAREKQLKHWNRSWMILDSLRRVRRGFALENDSNGFLSFPT